MAKQAQQTDAVPDYDALPVAQGTPEQLEALKAWVHTSGVRRARAQGLGFSEIDFVVGAMTAFYALGFQGGIPSSWVFGPMTGRSIFPTHYAPRESRVETRQEAVDKLTSLLEMLEGWEEMEHNPYIKDMHYPSIVQYLHEQIAMHRRVINRSSEDKLEADEEEYADLNEGEGAEE